MSEKDRHIYIYDARTRERLPTLYKLSALMSAYVGMGTLHKDALLVSEEEQLEHLNFASTCWVFTWADSDIRVQRTFNLELS